MVCWCGGGVGKSSGGPTDTPTISEPYLALLSPRPFAQGPIPSPHPPTTLTLPSHGFLQPAPRIPSQSSTSGSGPGFRPRTPHTRNILGPSPKFAPKASPRTPLRRRKIYRRKIFSSLDGAGWTDERITDEILFRLLRGGLHGMLVACATSDEKPDERIRERFPSKWCERGMKKSFVASFVVFSELCGILQLGFLWDTTCTYRVGYSAGLFSQELHVGPFSCGRKATI